MFANNLLVWYKLSYVKLPEGIPIYSHVFPIKPYKTTKNSYVKLPEGTSNGGF